MRVTMRVRVRVWVIVVVMLMIKMTVMRIMRFNPNGKLLDKVTNLTQWSRVFMYLKTAKCI